jgi:hypothetical protein
VNVKQYSISSYSDLQKISPQSEVIHFRKFLSKCLISEVLSSFKNLKFVSFSKYAYRRCNKDIIELIEEKGVNIIIRESKGRPSKVEKMMI